MRQFYTGYENYSRSEINHLFRDEEWSMLQSSERRHICQELENRLASDRGTMPRQIFYEDIEGTTFGYQYRDTITLNSNLIEYGGFRIEDDETHQNLLYSKPTPGWQIYTTICHEDTHGVQEDEGRIQTARSYLNSSVDYDLYRLQPSEREAFAKGYTMTLEAMEQEQREFGGMENEIETYENDIAPNDYERRLQEAKDKYGDNIQERLDRVVAERELYGRTNDLRFELLYTKQALIEGRDELAKAQNRALIGAAAYESQSGIGQDEAQDQQNEGKSPSSENLGQNREESNKPEDEENQAWQNAAGQQSDEYQEQVIFGSASPYLDKSSGTETNNSVEQGAEVRADESATDAYRDEQADYGDVPSQETYGDKDAVNPYLDEENDAHWESASETGIWRPDEYESTGSESGAYDTAAESYEIAGNSESGGYSESSSQSRGQSMG